MAGTFKRYTTDELANRKRAEEKEMRAMETYRMRYWDRKEIIVEGSLAQLSAEYAAFCEANSDFNHSPATLRQNDEEVGFVNRAGEVWLKQPSHIKVYP